MAVETPAGKLGVVYSCYLVPGWETCVSEQLAKVVVSGLYAAADSFVVVASGSREELHKFLVYTAPLAKLNLTLRTQNSYEFPAIEAVRNHAVAHPKDKICYFHTKGVTSGDHAWRKVLDYWTLLRWRENVAALSSNYDISGPLWLQTTDKHKFHFYAGNFWWANAAYLARLARLQYSGRNDRFECEAWIGCRRPRWYNVNAPQKPFTSLQAMRTYVRSPAVASWAERLDQLPALRTAMVHFRGLLAEDAS
jgi:hypothetical protein